MEDLIAIIIFVAMIGFIIYLFMKNKNEGKDDYSGFTQHTKGKSSLTSLITYLFLGKVNCNSITF